MAQASRQKALWHMAWRAPLARGTREGTFILVSTLAVYLLLSLVSYSPDDPGWSQTGRANTVLNQGGVVGAWLADVLLYLFGYMAYLFPLMVAVAGWLLTRNAGGRAGSRGDTLDGFHLSARAVGEPGSRQHGAQSRRRGGSLARRRAAVSFRLHGLPVSPDGGRCRLAADPQRRWPRRQQGKQVSRVAGGAGP